MERLKKLPARFYETPAGRKPVRDWLSEIGAENRRIVGYDIQTVEFGWPVGMPIATRYDKTAENFKASLQLVAVRIWLRGNESTS